MDRGYDGSIVVQKRIKRHRGWNRKLEALFRVSEMVLILLFLLSRYLSGVSVAVAAEFMQQLLCLLSKPLHVFFISTVIIIAVAVLSGIDADGRKNRKSGGVANGIYDEYVARRRAIAVGGNDLEVLPVVVDVPEDEKQIVLFTSSGPLIEGGKGLPTTTAAAHDGCAKSGCPRRRTKDEKLTDVASPRGRGRLALPGVVRGRVSGASAAGPNDGSVSNDHLPWMRMKAEKFIDEARLRRRTRSALPNVVGKHALKAPVTAVSVPATAGKHVIVKSLSEASINGDKALPTVVVTVGCCVPRNSRRERAMGDKNPAGLPSPHERGRLVGVRDVGSKTVEDMSNDEFNRSVANYIAKTRRFLREESMHEIDFDTMYRDRSILIPCIGIHPRINQSSIANHSEDGISSV